MKQSASEAVREERTEYRIGKELLVKMFHVKQFNEWVFMKQPLFHVEQ